MSIPRLQRPVGRWGERVVKSLGVCKSFFPRTAEAHCAKRIVTYGWRKRSSERVVEPQARYYP
jgi:hypothetical protein